MKGYTANIEKLTDANKNFRVVLYTAKHCQLVVMSLLPNEEIGMETHKENDQFFRVESGVGKVIIDGITHDVSDGFAIIVPAGATHNVINASDTKPLKLYTVYSPAHHMDAVVHRTKDEALADDEAFDGVTTE